MSAYRSLGTVCKTWYNYIKQHPIWNIPEFSIEAPPSDMQSSVTKFPHLGSLKLFLELIASIVQQ